MRFLIGALTDILGHPALEEAAKVLVPEMLPLAEALDPEGTGGAMLLGVDGVCVISHGSSSATAMVNAITVAHDLAVAGSGGGGGGRRHRGADPRLRPRRQASSNPLSAISSAVTAHRRSASTSDRPCLEGFPGLLWA